VAATVLAIGRARTPAVETLTIRIPMRLQRLTCLAPDIVEAILDGRQPKGLRLAEMLGNGPLAWEEQRSAWGFSRNLRRAISSRGGGAPTYVGGSSGRSL
jgi:hypothetical protein